MSDLDQNAATVVLDVRDVAVHFGGVKAVDGVSFTLEPGRILGIIGPNGSGKSTLLGAITRLTPLTRGEVELGGRPVHRLPAARLAAEGLARTFQTVRLLGDLTVAENVQLGLDALDPPSLRRDLALWRRRSSRPAGLVEVLERLGLSGYEDRYPSELSYGLQRRVEIARAVAMKPRLLLLDEPTAGMNQTERAEISALLKDLRSEGLAQLLVEHDVPMMVDTCDELLAMNAGRVIGSGVPASVIELEAVQTAYLGKKKGAAHA
jgi:branched-chain amino acid transport system ATP-binding protein